MSDRLVPHRIQAALSLAACFAWFGLTEPAVAQRATARHIGVLFVLLSPDGREAQAFRQGLHEAGYSEGRDVVIEWRAANGDYARVPELAADLVHAKVDVIVADTTLAAQAVKRATSTIPIVMTLAYSCSRSPSRSCIEWWSFGIRIPLTKQRRSKTSGRWDRL